MRFPFPCACRGNLPSLRRVRSRVASLLRLRSSESPSRRLVGRQTPPRLRGLAVGPMSIVAPESSFWTSQGDPRPPKVSSRGLLLKILRFQTLFLRFFITFRPRKSASRSSRLERERSWTFMLSTLDRNKIASQNTSKILSK